MSKWSEIICDFFDEIENKTYIIGWFTMDDDEDGEIIAKINIGTKHVEYLDEDAEFDEYAQKVIKEVLENGFNKVKL